VRECPKRLSYAVQTLLPPAPLSCTSNCSGKNHNVVNYFDRKLHTWNKVQQLAIVHDEIICMEYTPTLVVMSLTKEEDFGFL
jgi:hypothetical protein